MLNEWEEFQRYIETPVYASAGKNDHSYLGRFTFEMFAECTGLTRVLTVLARGYLFHDADGAILAADPRDRIGMAWRALCAWCSVPDNGKLDAKNKWKFKSDFTELHEEFPELVDERGGGWYYRHVHGVVAYTQSHPDAVMESALNRCRKLDETFAAAWRSKAVQCQIPPLAPTTKAQWLLSFTEILSNALELGPLRKETAELPPALLEKLECMRPTKIPRELRVLPTLISYYIVNHQPDTDWVVLPVVNFDAYFGTASFGKKYLSLIPPEILDRSPQHSGISRYRVLPEYLPEAWAKT